MLGGGTYELSLEDAAIMKKILEDELISVVDKQLADAFINPVAMPTFYRTVNGVLQGPSQTI